MRIWQQTRALTKVVPEQFATVNFKFNGKASSQCGWQLSSEPTCPVYREEPGCDPHECLRVS